MAYTEKYVSFSICISMNGLYLGQDVDGKAKGISMIIRALMGSKWIN